ncbi:MAG TPA: hypothetical protein VM580_24285, partial [Labilithrix sp.]|nr:hypothetical protein [Labilithrix sp.]
MIVTRSPPGAESLSGTSASARLAPWDAASSAARNSGNPLGRPYAPACVSSARNAPRPETGIAAELNSALGPAKSELASARRHDLTDDQLDTIRRRISHVHEVVAGLAAFGALRADEMAVEVDLVDVARATVKSLANIAERDDVKVSLRVRPEGSRVYVRHGTKALSVLAREVVAHAIEASPRGSRVEITVSAPEGNAGARLIVDDSGSA